MVAPDRESRQTETKKAVNWQKIVIPELVRREAREFLTIGQYVHVADFVKQLVGFGTRSYDRTITVAAIGDFWELKEKGGVLGRINVRVYFAFLETENEVVLLSAYKKEDDGKAPPHIIYRLRSRLRMYLSGDLSEGAIIFERKEEDD